MRRTARCDALSDELVQQALRAWRVAAACPCEEALLGVPLS